MRAITVFNVPSHVDCHIMVCIVFGTHATVTRGKWSSEGAHIGMGQDRRLTISSGLKIPNCTFLTCFSGADESLQKFAMLLYMAPGAGGLTAGSVKVKEE